MPRMASILAPEEIIVQAKVTGAHNPAQREWCVEKVEHNIPGVDVYPVSLDDRMADGQQNQAPNHVHHPARVLK